MPMPPLPRRKKQSMTDGYAAPRRRQADINRPVPLPYDAAAISPHERDVARYQSEDARTGAQTDEVPPTVVRHGSRSPLANLQAFLNRRIKKQKR